MKKLFLLFIVIFHILNLDAQQPDVVIQPRSLNEEKWKAASKDINYHQSQKRSLFQQETKKIGYEDLVDSKTSKPKDKIPNNNFNFDWSGLKYVGIVLLVCIAGILIYFFAKNATWMSDTKIDDLHSMLAEVEENLPEADVQTPLQRAIKEENFNVATRLYYLLLIQKLAEKNYIKWSKEKTNREYAAELRGIHFIEHFRQVTHIYEKAWFGKESVTQQSFEDFQPLFDTLIHKIV